MEKRLEILKPLIQFEKDEFIFVQIFQRRKDNPNLELSVKRLKSYSFYSWSELEEQMPRIQEICDLNNARAYIRMNKQNALDVSLRCISEISDNIRNGNPHKNKGVWDSVSGKVGSKDWWILDFDEEHMGNMSMYQALITDLALHFTFRNPERKLFMETNNLTEMDAFSLCKHETQLEYPLVKNFTKTGLHLICKPFDTRILDKYNKDLSSKGIATIQIQKDANTVLYIGNENPS